MVDSKNVILPPSRAILAQAISDETNATSPTHHASQGMDLLPDTFRLVRSDSGASNEGGRVATSSESGNKVGPQFQKRPDHECNGGGSAAVLPDRTQTK